MNTKIVKKLIGTTKPQLQEAVLGSLTEDIIKAHNSAALYGFTDLPLLHLQGVELDGDTITISVEPKSGMADLNDLFNIKTAWGADSIEVLTGENPAICINFKTK